MASIDFEDPQDAEHAGACDLGLPDSEICSPLSTPPVVMSSLQEAWSRGWASWTHELRLWWFICKAHT